MGWKIAEAAKAHLQPDVLYYHKTSQLIGHKMWWGGGIHLLCSFLGAALGCAIICAPFQARAQKKAQKENQTAHINAYLDEVEKDTQKLQMMYDEAVRMENASDEHYTNEQMQGVYIAISDQMYTLDQEISTIDENTLDKAQLKRLKAAKGTLDSAAAKAKETYKKYDTDATSDTAPSAAPDADSLLSDIENAVYSLQMMSSEVAGMAREGASDEEVESAKESIAASIDEVTAKVRAIDTNNLTGAQATRLQNAVEAITELAGDM